MRFAHTNIISNNWKSLVDFYVTTFNCKLVPPIRRQAGNWLDSGTGLNDAQLEGAHLLLPGHGENGPTLEIYQYRHIDQQDWVMPNKRGFGHLAFEVEDVQKILSKVLDNGGHACGEVTQKAVEGVGLLKFVYARDPEGNLLELQAWS
jgi:catechol 2,3-dioxygenase-like lactoylglutathione lyase family enzyme